MMLGGIYGGLLGIDERFMDFEAFFWAIVVLSVGFGMYDWANEKKIL